MILASTGNSEVWIPISKWCGKYEVSQSGQVRNSKTKKLLKRGINNRDGYLQVFGSLDGKTVAANVHRLVAEGFIPNTRNLPCVNHKNGNRLDPRLENLEWCSHKENTKHALEVLAHQFNKKLKNGKGEMSGAHKLTDAEVRDIKKMLRDGVSASKIADQFVTSKSNIRSIKIGATWSHIDEGVV